MVGETPRQRPSVRQNAFAMPGGPELHIVSYGKDDVIFQVPGEHEALYLHLTGDTTYGNFHFLNMPHSVHDSYISTPEDLTAILAQFI